MARLDADRPHLPVLPLHRRNGRGLLADEADGARGLPAGSRAARLHARHDDRPRRLGDRRRSRSRSSGSRASGFRASCRASASSTFSGRCSFSPSGAARAAGVCHRRPAPPRPPHLAPLRPRLRPDARGKPPAGRRPRPSQGASLEEGVGPGRDRLDAHGPRDDADRDARGLRPRGEDGGDGVPLPASGGGPRAWGAAGVAGGLAWSRWLPINKNLWTGSYVVFTSGAACVALAVSIVVVDLRGGSLPADLLHLRQEPSRRLRRLGPPREDPRPREAGGARRKVGEPSADPLRRGLLLDRGSDAPLPRLRPRHDPLLVGCPARLRTQGVVLEGLKGTPSWWRYDRRKIRFDRRCAANARFWMPGFVMLFAVAAAGRGVRSGARARRARRSRPRRP